MLYILSENGIRKEELSKLFQHAQVPTEEANMIEKLSNLGVNVISEVSKSIYINFIKLFFLLLGEEMQIMAKESQKKRSEKYLVTLDSLGKIKNEKSNQVPIQFLFYR